MSLRTKVKQLIVYGGVEEFEFKRIEKDIQANNRHIVCIFALISAITMAVMYITSWISESLSTNRLLYGIGFLLATAIELIAVYPGKKHRLIMIADMYLFAAVLLGVGIVLGTALSPHEISATFIALLLAMPQLFTDRPYRLYIMISASVAVFIVEVLHLKDPITWSSDITNSVLFGVISIILSTYSSNNRVSRYCLQERIRFMAENDQLTGLRNRNSYEKSISHASVLNSNAIYCVYVDVNGLHEMNNAHGHEAGDRMLQYIATAMQSLFGENETYRIGGDEFVAIGLDKAEEEINELVEKLKQNVETAGFHIAVGTSYRSKTGLEINSLVKEAEYYMYEDKNLFYEKNGGRRRR